MKTDRPGATRISPLHTPRKEAAAKRATIERIGRDRDGAYRVNRLDDADQAEVAV